MDVLEKSIFRGSFELSEFGCADDEKVKGGVVCDIVVGACAEHFAAANQIFEQSCASATILNIRGQFLREAAARIFDILQKTEEEAIAERDSALIKLGELGVRAKKKSLGGGRMLYYYVDNFGEPVCAGRDPVYALRRLGYWRENRKQLRILNKLH
jgi:hypothetical protein